MNQLLFRNVRADGSAFTRTDFSPEAAAEACREDELNSMPTALGTTSSVIPNTADARNVTTNAPPIVESIKGCINSMMYDRRFNPPRPLGISAEAAATACQNVTSKAPQVGESIKDCINSMMYDRRFNPPQPTEISASAAATACQKAI